MLRGLGGNTKSFKSYGKNKTNTKNRIVSDWADSDDSPEAKAMAPVIRRKIPSESGESSESSEEEIKVQKTRKTALKIIKGKRVEKENEIKLKEIQKVGKVTKPAVVVTKKDGKRRAPILASEEEDQEELVELEILERSPLKERVCSKTIRTKKISSTSTSSQRSKTGKSTPSPNRIISVLPDPSPELPIATTSQAIPKSVVNRNSTRSSNKSYTSLVSEDSGVELIQETVIPTARSRRSSTREIVDIPTVNKRVSRSSSIAAMPLELPESVPEESKNRRTSKRASVMMQAEKQEVLESEESVESEYLSFNSEIIPESVSEKLGEDELHIEEEIVEEELFIEKKEILSETEFLESENEGTGASVVVGRLSRSRIEAVNENEEELSATEEEEEQEIDELDSTLSEISLDYLPIPSSLQPLLDLTTSPNLYNFSEFLEQSPAPFTTAPWKKIGEASYSEVFSTIGKTGIMVIKVIPIDMELEEGEEEPYKSEVESVIREVEIGNAVGTQGLTGFVKFLGSFVVQGTYPQPLLEEWDRFKNAQTPFSDEQIKPDGLSDKQCYILICLEHGGDDLESFKLKSWTEAASILSQVAEICARAEELIQFEHRDLHWGNVLVKPTGNILPEFENLTMTPKKKVINGVPTSTGTLQVTLIDFTLSRANLGEEIVVFDEFADDCIFEGEGDEQFDVYRAMRSVTKSDWEGFYPLTNLLWLHYLTLKLLNSKKLKPPPAASSPLSNSSPCISSPLRASASGTRASRANPSTRRARTLPIKKSISLLRLEAKEREAWQKLVEAEKVLRGLEIVKKGRGKKEKRFQVTRDFLNFWDE